MKIHIMSDLHLEFAPFVFEPAEADICVVAGDVSPRCEDVVAFIEEVEKHCPVVFVPGNHEYYPCDNEPYGKPIELVDEWYRDAIGKSFYQKDVRSIAGITIAGCTLWSDFFNRDPNEMHNARRLTDYSSLLLRDDLLLTPTRAADLHNEMREFLSNIKADIVVTHHAPTRKSIGPEFTTSSFNGCFVNDMENVVARTDAKLWIHGHTHDATDYFVDQCRVVCNPRGYQGKGYLERTGFNRKLVVEI